MTADGVEGTGGADGFFMAAVGRARRRVGLAVVETQGRGEKKEGGGGEC